MTRFIPILVIPLVLWARDWTFMVYMAADNGLAQWADSDLVEMQKVGSDEDIAIIVQVDKPNIGGRRLYVDKNHCDELDNLGIIDMCSTETLSDFLAWGLTNYPAKRHCVVLWDHGSGWVRGPDRSFGSDWSSGNELHVYNGDLRQAFLTAHLYTGKEFSLLAFDACLMQQIEVAFELKDYVKVIVAPQTICPLAGYRYDQILEQLKASPGIDERQLAQRMVEINIDNYLNVQPLAISSIKTAGLDALKESLDDFYESLAGEPDQRITELRDEVQTIPLIGLVPRPQDDYVDMGDFILGLHNIFNDKRTEELLDAYNNTIIKNAYAGEDFSGTTGLTAWFPYDYTEFKQLLNTYTGLAWADSRWPSFLNLIYDQDDIRPSDASIASTTVGRNNDFRLFWNRVWDLAPVSYDLVEAKGQTVFFEDGCEDTSQWLVQGFSLSPNAHAGSRSFFSGNGSNLNNVLETRDLITIDGLGLMSLFLNVSTEDQQDSLIIEYGPFQDVHYGSSSGWIERRVLLPGGSYSLKVSYRTNNTINLGGCYIDDIIIRELSGGRRLRENYPDTGFYIFNKLKGDYYYGVLASDRYGNLGNVSNLMAVSIQGFALPYSNPNPFQNSCDLILDYPDSLSPQVEIYAITGRRVKRFTAADIENKRIHWNGRDENSREVGSGIYFVLLKAGSFVRLGKIARQR